MTTGRWLAYGVWPTAVGAYWMSRGMGPVAGVVGALLAATSALLWRADR